MFVKPNVNLFYAVGPKSFQSTVAYSHTSRVTLHQWTPLPYQIDIAHWFMVDHDCWWLSSPSTLIEPLAIQKLAGMEETPSSIRAWFLYVLSLRNMISLAILVCHLVLPRNQRKWQHTVVFWGILGHPWPKTQKEVCPYPALEIWIDDLWVWVTALPTHLWWSCLSNFFI